MNEKKAAMKVSSKVIAILMKIGYIMMIVTASICAAALIFIMATGGKTSINTSGGTRIMIADSLQASPETIVAICAALLVMSAFLFLIFWLTYRMFHEISVTGMPFQKKYVRTMKALGILIAVMTVAEGIVEMITSPYAGAELGIYNDSPGIIVGVIIFCLAYIFDYGCSLQAQYDKMLENKE